MTLINFNLQRVNFHFSFLVMCQGYTNIFNLPPPLLHVIFCRVDSNSQNVLGVFINDLVQAASHSGLSDYVF